MGIVGRSGSGKSTLLHLLAALDRPTSGEITVGPWQLSMLSRAEQARYRREMVGIIFQKFHLVPTMTAAENVALPLVLAGAQPEPRRARAAECLALVGLADRAGHRPAQLSGGEQQRIATARALAGEPPLPLADEPTGNLDSETGAQTLRLLRRLHEEHGRTVVVITHHFDEIAGAAEQVLALHDGRLQEEGNEKQKVTSFSTLDLLLRKGPTEGYPALRVQLAEADREAAVRRGIEALGIYAMSFRDQFQQFGASFSSWTSRLPSSASSRSSSPLWTSPTR